MAQFICQTSPQLFTACNDSLSPPNNDIAGTWRKVYGMTKWGLVPEVDESEALITSETSGKKIKPCPDIFTWSLENRTALSDTDANWLFGNFLADHAKPEQTVPQWWYATWHDDSIVDIAKLGIVWGPGATVTKSDTFGFIMLGFVNPGGIEIDAANGGTAVETDWTVEITKGPFFPDATFKSTCVE